MTPTPSVTVTVSIDRSPADVYAFVRDAERLPEWASGLARAVRRDGDAWIVTMPDGEMRVRFAPDNAFGVLDHTVTLAPGVDVLSPMRVVPNGAGSDVTFTVQRRPGMSDDDFEDDRRMVERDLHALKALLERRAA